jgi:hypothetical protein
VTEKLHQSRIYLGGTKKTLMGVHQTACRAFMLAATGVVQRKRHPRWFSLLAGRARMSWDCRVSAADLTCGDISGL